ncbi:MAG: prepilin-type N-terminal cleavage/methylation domain-containing protein [Acidobacteriota bacterium]
MKRRGCSGFTLLEVIVALALLGIGLAAVMQIFSGGLKNIHRMDMAHRAISHAENVMNEILTDEDISGPTHRSGDLDEDFSYSAEIEDWEEPETDLSLNADESTMRLLSIQVDVQFKNDRRGKFYRLRCLKAVSTREPLQLPGLGADTIQQLFGAGVR